MPSGDALQTRLLELRQSFDRAFTEPFVEDAVETSIELLAIRVGRDPFALRMSEIAALEADRTITSVPSEHPELLGIAGVRGSVVAVFDLGALLGGSRTEGLRWLVLAKAAPLAFAFSAFDGQLSVRPEALAAAESSRAGRVREVARGGGLSLPVIDLPVLIAALDQRPRTSGLLSPGGA
jgi:chemotaxis signal transduction protein